jgi:hypothetical protein
MVDDAEACRCGSGLEEISILDGGSGYVSGRLLVPSEAVVRCSS